MVFALVANSIHATFHQILVHCLGVATKLLRGSLLMTFAKEIQTILTEWLERIRRERIEIRVPPVKYPYIARKGLHFHPVPEIALQLAGVSVMRCREETVRCKAGEIMVLPRGTGHNEEVQKTAGQFRNIVILFGQHTVSIHAAEAGRNRRPRQMQFHQIAVEDPGRIYLFLDELIAVAHSGRTHADEAMQGLMTAFLAALLDTCDQPAAIQRNDSFKTSLCRRLITEHLSDPSLNVSWLSRQIGCSADYLSNLFHRETGSTITDHINTKRIAFAGSLLETSRLNIAEISQACGYQNPGYFTRQFRRRAGKTPREFRRLLRMS